MDVESCLQQPSRQARPFPTPWLHYGPWGGLGVGTFCRCFLLFRRAFTRLEPCSAAGQPSGIHRALIGWLEAGGLVLLCPCVERPRALMVRGVSLCVFFDVCCLLSLVAPLLCRACKWGAWRLLHACSGSTGGCTLVHPSRCAQSGLGVVAGASGEDANSILLEGCRQALFGGPLARGVAARSWLWIVESCLQPSRQARPFPTPWLHYGPRGGRGVAHFVVVSCCFGGLIQYMYVYIYICVWYPYVYICMRI